MKLHNLLKRFTRMMIFFLFTCLSFSLPQFASSDFNISKIGEWGGYSSTYSDVTISGNYAYCVGNYGLDIVDISTPSFPKLVGSYKPSTYYYPSYQEVEVVNNRAYSIRSDENLYVFDVSTPSNPSLLGTIELSGYGGSLAVENHYAYVGHNYEKSIDIIDISGTTLPSTITTYNAEWPVYDLHASGDYLYVASLSSGVKILDVSTPTSPTIVSEIENVHANARHVFTTGNYAYVIEQHYGLIIYDISTPQAPKKVGEYLDNKYYDDVHVAGSLAFTSKFEILSIIDVSDPSNPVLKNDFQYTYSAPKAILCKGDLIYIADQYRGLRIMDISDPANPRYLGSLENYGDILEMLRDGNYLYLGRQHGLHILDVSNSSAPTHTGFAETNIRVHSMAKKGAYVFLLSGYDNPRFQVYNVSNPQTPTKAAEVGLSGSTSRNGIAIKDNYAYINCRDNITIFDISDPTNPAQAGSLDCSVSCYSFCIYGNYAYQMSESNMAVLNISSPATPTEVNTFSLGDSYYSTARGMAIKGNYAYITGLQGLLIYDLSNPVSPSLVNHFDHCDPEYIIVAGNYAYFEDDYRSIFVLDLSDPVSPLSVGYYSSEDSITPIAPYNNLIYTDDGLGRKVNVLRFQPVETPPKLALNRDSLYFSAVVEGAESPDQSVWVENQGSGTLEWAPKTNEYWIEYSPYYSGTGSGELKVWVDIYSNMTAGSYTGTLTVRNNASMLDTKTITIYVQVYEPGTTTPPFGEMATPVNGSVVSGSVPFTGWALDDVGVEDVTLQLKTGNSWTPIGEAVFVEGARPDIVSSYPTYPRSYKAGWGYMMLTNFLPNGGNGTYVIRAAATDMEGSEVILGSTTIHVDNVNAVKPFGAIDTPVQGGSASGASFINYGWALTPLPNTIPGDGSTITVWLDGQPLGHPVYNQYRSDIAELFPGYHNSGGAGGYYYLDTTKYGNGVHTIYWTAEDNAGNSDGIGSRYFSIQNSENRAAAGTATKDHMSGGNLKRFPDNRRANITETVDIDNVTPVLMRKGFIVDGEFEILYPGESGDILVEIKELERLEIVLIPPEERLTDAEKIAVELLTPLPIGASLDARQGVFYWTPGVGFVGDYSLSFLVKGVPGEVKRRDFLIRINPKF